MPKPKPHAVERQIKRFKDSLFMTVSRVVLNHTLAPSAHLSTQLPGLGGRGDEPVTRQLGSDQLSAEIRGHDTSPRQFFVGTTGDGYAVTVSPRRFPGEAGPPLVRFPTSGITMRHGEKSRSRAGDA